MAYTTSYITPAEDMSLEDRRAARKSGQDWLLNSGAEMRIRFNQGDLLIRDIYPNTDLGLAAQRDWLVAGAGVVGTDLQYFVPTLPAGRVIVFWGAGTLMALPGISVLRLTQGAASATTRGEYQLETLYNAERPVGFFSEPVGFLPNEVARGMVMPRLAFAVNTERLFLLGRVLEPIGAIISAPSL